MNDSFMLTLKQKLDQCIDEFSSVRHMYCRNPESDFTRTRKLSFSDVVHFLIEMHSKSLPNEVMDYFGHNLETPTVSRGTKYFHQVGNTSLLCSVMSVLEYMIPCIRDIACWPVMALM